MAQRKKKLCGDVVLEHVQNFGGQLWPSVHVYPLMQCN